MKYSTIVGRSNMPFQFFLGGRGIGKTYSALEEIANNKDMCAMWARRIGDEMAEVCDSGLFSGLQKNGKALNMSADYTASRGIGHIYRDDAAVGYTAGISLFAKKRGVDYPDITHIFVDELSPEEHRPYYKGEGRALMNMYESINRNRELDGAPPVYLICLSNCVRLDTPIFLTLGIVPIIQRMIESGQQRCTIPERCLYIEIMENLEVSSAKSQTALYRLLGESSTITKANLKNQFVFDDLSIVKPRRGIKLGEYLPLIQYGDIAICIHKSNETYYCYEGECSAATRYEAQETQLFCRNFAFAFKIAAQSHDLYVDKYSTFIFLAQVLNYKY